MNAIEKETFQPIRFLSAMATGGLASAPWFLKTASDAHGIPATVLTTVSVFFILVHYGLTAGLLIQGRKWFTGPGQATLRKNWMRSPQILMPLGSLAMSINVFLGPLHSVVPGFDTWSFLWMPVLAVFWAFLAATSLFRIADLVAVLYSQSIEITRLGFVWLFPSLTLGLVAASGSFIASMADIGWVAHIAGIGSAITALFGLFLISILLPTIVRNQLASPALPPLGGAYSMLNMVPTVVLYGIAFAHWSQYAERWFSWSMHVPAGLAVLVSWAFVTGYALFGLRLLFTTIRSDLTKGNYVGNQWALSCVPIAWTVMTLLLQHSLFPSRVWIGLATVAFVATLPVFVLLVIRMARCIGWLPAGRGGLQCA